MPKIKKRDMLKQAIIENLSKKGIVLDTASSIQEVLQKAENVANLPVPTRGMPFSTTKGRLHRAYNYLTGHDNEQSSVYVEIENGIVRGKEKPTKPDKVISDQAKLNRFYNSYEWKQLRYTVLKKYRGRCMLCNRSDLPLHIDHIKPLRKNWSLRLDITNLQILCEECNYGKGNWDESDWREKSNSDNNILKNLNDYLSQWHFWDDLSTSLRHELVSGIISISALSKKQ